ncbi:MAG: hypothetical protein ACP5TJ_01450 [Candidatus Micrarchaeia archaeon]
MLGILGKRAREAKEEAKQEPPIEPNSLVIGRIKEASLDDIAKAIAATKAEEVEIIDEKQSRLLKGLQRSGSDPYEVRLIRRDTQSFAISGASLASLLSLLSEQGFVKDEEITAEGVQIFRMKKQN